MLSRTTKRLLLGSWTGLIISACALVAPTNHAGGDGRTHALTDTAWVVHQIGEESGSDVQALTLDFAEKKRISGHDGCNAFSGEVSVSDSSIRISDKLMGTMMSCTDAVEAVARVYRIALTQARRYRIQGKNLQLIDGEGNVRMVLIPAEMSLAGSRWDAISYNNGKQAIVSVIAGTKITAQFGEDGRITGHAGCNAYVAAYLVEGRRMTIELPGSTRRACPESEGVMEQEAAYLQVLPLVRQYQISGNRMELRDVQGSLVAILARGGK